MKVDNLRIMTNTSIRELIKKVFREVYGVEDDALSLPENTALREKIRNAVKKLRKSYDKPLCDTDYSDDEIRKAYMIAYYPYYIEPARYVMEKHIIKELYKIVQIEYEGDVGDENGGICWGTKIYDERDDWRHAPEGPGYYTVNLSFFACGPCPELLGVVAVLKAEKFCDKVHVTTFDMEEGWLSYQKITRKFCEKIMPVDGLWKFCHHSIGDLSAFDDLNFLNILHNTQIFFMQNYFSHLAPEDVENFLQWFSAVAKWAHCRALFVFIDLNYKKDSVGKEPAPAIAFRQLVDKNFLTANGLIKIAKYTHDEGDPLEVHHEDTTRTLLSEIFTGEKYLWHRWMTNFYFIVLQKTAYPRFMHGAYVIN